MEQSLNSRELDVSERYRKALSEYRKTHGLDESDKLLSGSMRSWRSSRWIWLGLLSSVVVGVLLFGSAIRNDTILDRKEH
jgi:hypothetical protein